MKACYPTMSGGCLSLTPNFHVHRMLIKRRFKKAVYALRKRIGDDVSRGGGPAGREGSGREGCLFFFLFVVKNISSSLLAGGWILSFLESCRKVFTFSVLQGLQKTVCSQQQKSRRRRSREVHYYNCKYSASSSKCNKNCGLCRLRFLL